VAPLQRLRGRSPIQRITALGGSHAEGTVLVAIGKGGCFHLKTVKRMKKWSFV